MAMSARAGGPADLGMAERGKVADRAWEGVEAAIGWVLELRPGRDVVLVLSRAEAVQLASVVGQGWGDGDHAGWLGNRRHVAACQRAMDKLRQALDASRPADRASRADRFTQPAEAIGPASGRS